MKPIPKYIKGFTRLKRSEPQPMEDVISKYIKEMKLAAGLNEHRIYAAWDVVSGAGAYTINKNFRNGILYVAISSSVVRNQLYFQRDILVESLNEYLRHDELFVKDDPRTRFVSKIILQ